MKLVFASINAHKLAEVRHILSQIEVVSLRDIGFLQEIDETGQTLEENSRLKAITVWQWLISNHLDSEYNGVFADDPTVIVDFNNMQISVLGDVKKPGKINIEKDRYTIIDAISDAGDLAITGKRENVIVLREENGEQKSYSVNLNDAAQLFGSPVYYMQQNDIVYVEPNKKASGQYSINSNTMRSTSFWFSAVSLILTLVTFFTR